LRAWLASTWASQWTCPTHGEQEDSVWNGHYACTCYHPLFVFNQFGDLERSALRPGNVHSADGWGDVLKPDVARYQGKVLRIYFRADAAFAMPGVYEYLEAERIKYAIRNPGCSIKEVSRDSCSSTRFGTHQYSGDDSQSGCGTQANTYSHRTRSQGASSVPGEGSLERRLNGKA
jgi:Transposase DDE domain group 1